MNKIASRAWISMVLVVALLGGFGFFCFQYFTQSSNWVVESGSPHVYNGGNIGCGIVVDRKILYGAHGAGGEIGHMTVNPLETEVCTCGKQGCAEQYCSATGIVRLTKKHLAASAFPSVLRGKDFSCKDVFDAADAGDPVALSYLETFYANTAEFISNICCVLNPEAVVIGGGVSKAGDRLLEGIRRHMDRFLFHAVSNVQLSLATLGNDAGAIGAFRMILAENN